MRQLIRNQADGSRGCPQDKQVAAKSFRFPARISGNYFWQRVQNTLRVGYEMRIKMKHWVVKSMAAGLGGAVGLVMFGCESVKPEDGAAEAGPKGKGQGVAATKKTAEVDFLTEVKPLLEYYCLRCHNTGTLLGDLNLETRKLALAPGRGGPFIIPGEPEASKFYQVLQLQEGNKEAMPPEKHRMGKEQREMIYRWIKQGAKWPSDSRGTLRPVTEQPAVAMVGGI
jgi:hypothetical protein